MYFLNALKAGHVPASRSVVAAAVVALLLALSGLLGACASEQAMAPAAPSAPPPPPKVEIDAANLPFKIVSEKTVGGFKWPESVAYDPAAKVLYVSEFGSKLAPAEKDGAGYIMKVGLDGKVIEERFLPGPGVTLNKPKGLWVEGNRLWVTDIDGVWVFDVNSKKGRKVVLPGAVFANDPMVMNKTLYVTDNRGDMLFSVSPADFLDVSGEPKAEMVWQDKGLNPNGIYPAKDGAILMVGFKSAEAPRGIYAQTLPFDPRPQSSAIGRLDGLYEMDDGGLLVTDWNNGSVNYWSEKGGMQPFGAGFKGPADLCAFPHDGGLMVVVPDLVTSQLRIFQLGKK